MNDVTLPCFVCGKALEPAMPGEVNQPFGGVVFQARGAYGSTVWDPFDGSFLEITICDECVRAAPPGHALIGRPAPRVANQYQPYTPEADDESHQT